MACPERTRAERSLGVTENRECIYIEVYWYTVTADQLARLGAAEEATIRFEGIDGHVERQFSAENLANIQAFVIQQVPEATTPSR